ncbi:nucleotidyltransferase family protein [Aliiglaciecola sp. LCG003]|uniref:nucleotidyltransferase family protein n=1 Tax=Aliiglaciecola sp. LCG003 TaxID=3053655 RepID=UPI00257277EC|nr:nucleotidyltransferase family protein [Aliiglaciecola sp. LCG003]WJG08455.1 nucleotidyltransferase family protein [Aliiglaciecola sp. LCG003]
MIDTRSLFSLLLEPKVGVDYSLSYWQEVIFILREAKVLASLYHSAQRHGCLNQYPEFAQKHLNSAQVYADRQALQINFEASELRLLFEEIDVTAIFLKGAGYTLRDSSNSRGRICSDIDVLVNQQDLAKAEAHLKSRRWKSEPLSDYDEKYYRQWAHEIPPLIHLNRATVVDMHHNLYPPISGRSPDVSSFIASRQKTQNGCFVLDPASTVMHSIIHMFANEDSSSWMRDMLDILLLIEEFGDDAFWLKLLDLSKQTGFNFETLCCLRSIQYYSEILLPEIAQQFVANFPLSKRQAWLLENAFIPAVAPEHDQVLGRRHKVAKNIVYLRGHWIKMPTSILFKHFVIKLFLSLRDQLVGKHQFDPKLPNNPNW